MLGGVGDLVVPVFRSSRDAEANCQHVGALAVIEGIFTGWLPGYLLLNGLLK
jgi:hypothetical protein